MVLSFFYSFQSEWLKTRRSLAAWLVVIGGFFIPLIFLCARYAYSLELLKNTASPNYWQAIFSQCWQAMSLFLLPMGVILATSLITQLEFRNNAWKQVHTTPQPLTRIFFAKLSVILVMMFQFFVLFNIGIFIAGIVPNLLAGVALPVQPFPWGYYFEQNALFFVDCLPIIALQYLISLQFKNFILPISIGFGLMIASLIAMEWKYGYTMPYIYSSLHFFELKGIKIEILEGTNLHQWAFGYFVLFTLVGYVLYLTKREKG